MDLEARKVFCRRGKVMDEGIQLQLRWQNMSRAQIPHHNARDSSPWKAHQAKGHNQVLSASLDLALNNLI